MRRDFSKRRYYFGIMYQSFIEVCSGIVMEMELGWDQVLLPYQRCKNELEPSWIQLHLTGFNCIYQDHQK